MNGKTGLGSSAPGYSSPLLGKKWLDKVRFYAGHGVWLSKKKGRL